MRRLIVVGAAGRDFHNFNVAFRDDPAVEVVAFTAAQIPGIADRRYPAALAGRRYPDGIPIRDESELAALCRQGRIDEVVFAYSDVSHDFVMGMASVALAAGADFTLLGPKRTMLRSSKPTIAVCAARTGVGKSQTTRWLAGRFRARGLRAVVVRHPMPYGDLARIAVQRFERLADLDAADCTIEEREEYEPHVADGNIVFAGVDYARILACAEAEADVILWDGGNNDFSFLTPDLSIALTDPFRALDAGAHHPGEAVVRMADIVAVAKANAASRDEVEAARGQAKALAPAARLVEVGSRVTLDDPAAVAGRRVVVVEDGPTTTHGGLPAGAGLVGAEAAGAEIVDPRPYAVGALAEAYDAFPHLGPILPALGYTASQRADLKATLEACPVDIVIVGSPIDLGHVIRTGKTVVRARYALDDFATPSLGQTIDEILRARGFAEIC